MPNFRAIKISRGTTPPGYAGTVTNLQTEYIFRLNTPKNPYLNQVTQKNTCQNFPTQKNPEIENFNPKKSFDHPCHLKFGLIPPGNTRKRENVLRYRWLNLAAMVWKEDLKSIPPSPPSRLTFTRDTVESRPLEPYWFLNHTCWGNSWAEIFSFPLKHGNFTIPFFKFSRIGF